MKWIFFFLISFHLYAQSTTFVWMPDKRKNDTGQCYQIDSETLGQKFKSKVKKEQCRPEKTYYLFVAEKSNCYEVDEKTGGKQYINRVSLDLCRPLQTITEILEINGKTACYEADKKTRGQYFHKKVDKKLCQLSSQQETGKFNWKYKAPGKGECFKEIISHGEVLNLKVKEQMCRPKKTVFRFIKQKQISGICVEEDSSDSHFYSQKVPTEKCKPEDTVFIFYTPPRKKQGKCFEVDSETKGNFYINIVPDNQCAP